LRFRWDIHFKGVALISIRPRSKRNFANHTSLSGTPAGSRSALATLQTAAVPTCRDVPNQRETTVPPGDVLTLGGVRLRVEAAYVSRPQTSQDQQPSSPIPSGTVPASRS